jgi:integrase/recombinase XerC
MESTRQLYRKPTDWLLASQFAPYVDAFTHHLTEGRYASHTVGKYLGCLAHFARWTTRCRLNIRQIDEDAVRRFLDGHLPRCECAKPVRVDFRDLRAALGHWLVVLRANGVIAEPPVGTTPVDEELRRFDEHMHHVRGLAPKTRSACLCTVRRLLIEQFADQPVVFSSIKPDDLRSFVARQSELYSTPASFGTLAAALRGYFRFRTMCGDQVHRLIGVVCYPANWQQASLPKALSGNEVKRLLGALGDPSRSSRRDDAIVRCALDLGLRGGEVAKLGLDDIDWRAGTVTLRRTKSRREDILPLPEATGRAIADYLKYERPQTTNRAVFVRRVAPRDQPIGPDFVRKAIRQAYARAGLPYTRAHLLRHTMASRLLEGGSSLKEVADVLRHRSLNTTLIYAKLDSRSLREVALPWPGGAA